VTVEYDKANTWITRLRKYARPTHMWLGKLLPLVAMAQIYLGTALRLVSLTLTHTDRHRHAYAGCPLSMHINTHEHAQSGRRTIPPRSLTDSFPRSLTHALTHTHTHWVCLPGLVRIGAALGFFIAWYIYYGLLALVVLVLEIKLQRTRRATLAHVSAYGAEGHARTEGAELAPMATAASSSDLDKAVSASGLLPRRP
jgi:hypothetical protein